VLHEDIQTHEDQEKRKQKGGDGVDPHLEILRDEEYRADTPDDPAAEVAAPRWIRVPVAITISSSGQLWEKGQTGRAEPTRSG